ncbi:DNA-binding transcriptional regulator, GntR family [Bartonella apihabitans]|uniref:DNA-binding transcriptional regulator, GntR family n=1 Tax=Bartonella apihabitans TaxID=2750929 RepID=A0A1U9MDG9_9HYPH|nr:GntR family transcriptional regulator [Bartonella apihabitans]AQT43316.1 DNA-binding transcriptional regulator, GntR family [Bartonella apihabitans]
MKKTNDELSLADQTVKAIEAAIINGHYHPGEHLSEAILAKKLSVSRNTLREAFRMLTKNGLIEYRANRGVFVTIPDFNTIIDVYRLRKIIEVGSVRNVHFPHSAIFMMDKVVGKAEKLCEEEKWQDVGTADMEFHQLLVSLGNSPRLDRLFAELTVELRLIFGLISDLRSLHQPFVAMNRAIVNCLKKEKAKKAAKLLGDYLKQSEKMIIEAYSALQK